MGSRAEAGREARRDDGALEPGGGSGGGRGAQRKVQVEGSAGRVCVGTERREEGLCPGFRHEHPQDGVVVRSCTSLTIVISVIMNVC